MAGAGCVSLLSVVPSCPLHPTWQIHLHSLPALVSWTSALPEMQYSAILAIQDCVKFWLECNFFLGIYLKSICVFLAIGAKGENVHNFKYV
jgi:hypothetical protein